MNKLILLSVILAGLIYCDRTLTKNDNVPVELITLENLSEIPPLPAIDNYGFRIGEFSVIKGKIKRNENLYLILREFDVSREVIHNIQVQAVGKVDLRKMIPGQKYRIYQKDGRTAGFVWHQSIVDYITFRWSEDGEDIEITNGAIELRSVEKTFSGVIKTSLYDAISNGGASRHLGQHLADIYAWEIDFFSLRMGDSFKVIFDELYADDEFFNIRQIKAAEFTHRGQVFKAYYFDNGERFGFFDEHGNSLEKALLKAPFKYNQRVSSGFSRNRMHPILNQRRPHYGVDYAARPGTPVLSVGDGIVTEARYRGGNGNIVQIRHNSTYKTAYLHLQRFANGIKPGVQVRQGDIIGYVGSTGLATGPHLCYRLYKNNNPVNSLRLELPSSDALEEEYLEEFYAVQLMWDNRLNEIDSYEQLAHQQIAP
ncbi:MAG: peptidoglycan DD-metalloendopeptidase family protein [Balneolaceae bacterium]